jgi:hypothetical protein
LALMQVLHLLLPLMLLLMLLSHLQVMQHAPGYSVNAGGL